MDEANDYKELLERYINNNCSPEEFKRLMDFLQNDKADRVFLMKLSQDFDNREAKSDNITSIQSRQILQKLLLKVQPVSQARGVLLRGRIWKIAFAAAVIIIVGVSTYLLSVSGEKPISNSDKGEAKNTEYKNDALPGTNKATLTLADGTVVELDDSNNGTLAQQGDTKIIKLGAKLAYNASANNGKEILYNTISTPRGGQYEIELPDGSHVWLNSASSLRFPTSFAGKERKVTITGEGYFEIVKNASMPFIVSVNTTEIRVLGTQFNVMGYEDDLGIKTTLLEGAVKLTSDNSKCLLKPGQQSHLLKGGDFQVYEANIAEAIAWKNGRFYFERAEIKNVMSQLSRWYNFEIVYKRKIDTRFYLEVSRNRKLSEILKMLELTGNIKFEIIRKTIIVS